MRTAEEIREEAQSVFPKDVLNGLEQWYRGMLDGTWRYVVFVTERSYLLALAMERMTGEYMEDCESEFLTGEGFSLRYGEIAKTYEHIGTFPKILLCDDVMDYGREMNHFICCTQDAVCRCLGGKADATEICKNLAQMTRIWIYARADTGSILMGRYVRKFVSAETGEKNRSLASVETRRKKAGFCNQYAYDTMRFLHASDISCAGAVYTERIPAKQEDRIINLLESSGNGFVKTQYGQNVQYVKYLCLGTGEKTMCIASLRIVKYAGTDWYRVIPYVFLPDMDAADTHAMMEIVMDKIPEKYRRRFFEWNEIPGRRGFNSIISMLFADAVLKKFNADFGIIPDRDDARDELDRLARYCDGDCTMFVNQMLNDLCIGIHKDSLFFMDDIEHIANMVRKSNKPLIMPDARHTMPVDHANLRRRVEESFYNKAWLSERELYRMSINDYKVYTTNPAKHARYAVPFRAVLFGLTKDLSMECALCCLSYILHMTDMGMVSLSSYADDDADVKGFTQYINVERTSLVIRALWDYRYIPMLSRMQYVACRQDLGHDYTEKKLTAEIVRYGNHAGWDKELTDRLTEFVSTVSQTGQSPQDWNGAYMGMVDMTAQEMEYFMKEQHDLEIGYAEFSRENAWDGRKKHE